MLNDLSIYGGARASLIISSSTTTRFFRGVVQRIERKGVNLLIYLQEFVLRHPVYDRTQAITFEDVPPNPRHRFVLTFGERLANEVGRQFMAVVRDRPYRCYGVEDVATVVQLTVVQAIVADEARPP